MTLKDYMKLKSLTQAEFGALIGARQQHVQKWLSGTTPTAKHIKAIHLETKGLVTIFDWDC